MGYTVFWFRRDLRLEDNTGLYFALKDHSDVQPVFVFDKNILDKLEEKKDARVAFIHRALMELQDELVHHGSSLQVYYGDPYQIFTEMISRNDIHSLYANHDYEPYALERDRNIIDLMHNHGIEFNTYKDQVVFEKSEVVKTDGTPYTVFTPYMNKWKNLLAEKPPISYDVNALTSHFRLVESKPIPSLEDIGFSACNVTYPDKILNDGIVKNYHLTRDIPSIQGTSRMSVHLRFGTVSIRHLVRTASQLNEKWLNELIWREFYMGNILWHFPHVVQGSFKPVFDLISWENNEDHFAAWCQGKTGYPIVDAGMRELNATGYMHNRVRMITASFLVKHLLTDWRWGEAYFAKKLLDYELSSNNGGWQWAAGTGCDAAPYFRVFNPYTQASTFDPQEKYIRQWVPEIRDPDRYPKPIVDHAWARNRAIETFQKALRHQ